jgi:hypothetical protein
MNAKLSRNHAFGRMKLSSKIRIRANTPSAKTMLKRYDKIKNISFNVNLKINALIVLENPIKAMKLGIARVTQNTFRISCFSGNNKAIVFFVIGFIPGRDG